MYRNNNLQSVLIDNNFSIQKKTFKTIVRELVFFFFWLSSIILSIYIIVKYNDSPCQNGEFTFVFWSKIYFITSFLSYTLFTIVWAVYETLTQKCNYIIIAVLASILVMFYTAWTLLGIMTFLEISPSKCQELFNMGIFMVLHQVITLIIGFRLLYVLRRLYRENICETQTGV